MKIRDVQLSTDDRFVTLSAICKIRRIGEDVVYFHFDKKNKDYIFSDASPFAAALLIPSMKQGEDLIIHGSISEELYHGMQQIMRIMLEWNIGLHPITIKADTIVKDIQDPAITATFFSGGVDSFYTYLKHKKDTTDKLTHFLLVDGYDIDPRNTDLWESTLANVEQVARAEEIQLVTAKSNIRWLLNPILAWGYTHGGCLAAIALCLRGKLGKVYIPSSVSLSQQIPWGTHPSIDHLWGTEKLTIVHDGTDVTRLEKVKREVAKSPVALTHLRVCYMNVRDTYNCCRCEKCLRTMIILKIAGVLDQAKTFSPTIDEGLVSKLSIEEDDVIFHEENLAALKQLQIEPALQKALENSLKNRVVMKPSFLSLVGQQVLYLDHAYNHSRVYKVASKALGKKF
jgi:hypothetical protein